MASAFPLFGSMGSPGLVNVHSPSNGWNEQSQIWFNQQGMGHQGVEIVKIINEGENKTMDIGYVKEYFAKHRELVMGLSIVLLLDHFVFEGAFREKLKRIVHTFLDKAEGKLHTIEAK